jgi:hypothetical protein
VSNGLTVDSVDSELLYQRQRRLRKPLSACWILCNTSEGLTTCTSTANGQHHTKPRVLLLQLCQRVQATFGGRDIFEPGNINLRISPFITELEHGQ